MTKWIGYALMGIGGIWVWDRYRTARDAGVPMIDAFKAPLSGVRDLVTKAAEAGSQYLSPAQKKIAAANAQANGKKAAAPAPAQEQTPQYPDDSDDVLEPNWIYNNDNGAN